MVLKDVKEANRSERLGRRFFCSSSCATRAGNVDRRAQEIVLVCPCGKRFQTTTRKKSAKHCSRGCASRFSVTETRREASRVSGLRTSNLYPSDAASISAILKRREAWKYAALERVLVGRKHEFEYKLGKYVFDLALFDTKTLVEFDGPYHRDPKQKQTDANKEKAAGVRGFVVVRRLVKPAVVIDPETIGGL